MKIKKKKFIRATFLLAGISVLFYMMDSFGFENILSNLSKTGWYFMPILGVWLIIYLFNSSAWYFILGDKRPNVKFSTVLGINVSGNAINYMTPMASMGGEPYKILVMKKYVGGEAAVSSVILYTMVIMLSHFWFWILGAFCMVWGISGSDANLWMIVAVVPFPVLMILMFRKMYRKGFLVWLSNLVKKFSFLGPLENKIEKNRDKLEKIDENIRNFHSNSRKVLNMSFAFIFLARIIGSLEFYFILRAIDINIGLVEAIYISAASSLVMNLVFFMPFQLGSREGSLYFIVQSLGFVPGIGVYIGLMNRIREFFWMLIGLILIPINGHKVGARARIE